MTITISKEEERTVTITNKNDTSPLDTISDLTRQLAEAREEIADLRTEITLCNARLKLNPLPGDNIIHDEAEIRRLYSIASEARAEIARLREEIEIRDETITILSEQVLSMNDVDQEEVRLRKAMAAMLDLINSSQGVYGLHLNGDGAPWDSLRTGGQFEDWMLDFDKALEASDGLDSRK